MIFDGRIFAKELENDLVLKVRQITEKLGRKVVLYTIFDPTDEASRVYTNIKAKKADELGIEFKKIEVINPKSEYLNNIKNQIFKLNNDAGVDGILIQMPLFNLELRALNLELARAIVPSKDADGLNPESEVVPATVKAVIKILNSNVEILNNTVVVGQRGLVGSSLLKQLPGAVGMSANDLDLEVLKSADVVISATGSPGLIKPEMVKDGVACIDVGYPQGDFDPQIAEKAAFFTPVPGGVGPVTVMCLFDNLLELVDGREY